MARLKYGVKSGCGEEGHGSHLWRGYSSCSSTSAVNFLFIGAPTPATFKQLCLSPFSKQPKCKRNQKKLNPLEFYKNCWVET
jgi:hypothetical protein